MNILPMPQLLPSLFTNEGIQKIAAAFTSIDAPIRFVGGAVRDALLGVPITDIDLATPLLPEISLQLLYSHGLKTVPTGIKHGTVTVYYHGQSFEITTLRRDVHTDGRWATVAFTDDWQADASRRDFTFNALSCSLDGDVYDYFNGIEDLHQGIVRFVGDPYTRISEDFLRILRFFRFSAYYGKSAPGSTALAACSTHAASLATLSGERVESEMMKIFLSPSPTSTLALMQEQGVLEIILPEKPDFQPLSALIDLEHEYGLKSTPLRRLAILLRNSTVKNADSITKRWKLSNKQHDYLKKLLRPDAVIAPSLNLTEQKKMLRYWGSTLFTEIALITWAEQQHPPAPELAAMLALAASWEAPIFPLSGNDLHAIGIPKGKALGQILKAMETLWEANGYSASKETLLSEVHARYVV